MPMIDSPLFQGIQVQQWVLPVGATGMAFVHERLVPHHAYVVTTNRRLTDGELLNVVAQYVAKRNTKPDWVCLYRRNHGPGITWPCGTQNAHDDPSCGACGEPKPTDL